MLTDLELKQFNKKYFSGKKNVSFANSEKGRNEKRIFVFKVFIEACRQGEIKDIQRILDVGNIKNIINIPMTKTKKTRLHEIFKIEDFTGKSNTLSLLIKNGGDVNSKDKKNNSIIDCIKNDKKLSFYQRKLLLHVAFSEEKIYQNDKMRIEKTVLKPYSTNLLRYPQVFIDSFFNGHGNSNIKSILIIGPGLKTIPVPTDQFATVAQKHAVHREIMSLFLSVQLNLYRALYPEAKITVVDPFRPSINHITNNVYYVNDFNKFIKYFNAICLLNKDVYNENFKNIVIPFLREKISNSYKGNVFEKNKIEPFLGTFLEYCLSRDCKRNSSSQGGIFDIIVATKSVLYSWFKEIGNTPSLNVPKVTATIFQLYKLLKENGSLYVDDQTFFYMGCDRENFPKLFPTFVRFKQPKLEKFRKEHPNIQSNSYKHYCVGFETLFKMLYTNDFVSDEEVVRTQQGLHINCTDIYKLQKKSFK